MECQLSSSPVVIARIHTLNIRDMNTVKSLRMVGMKTILYNNNRRDVSKIRDQKGQTINSLGVRSCMLQAA